jgi:hypothetical protein
VYASYLGGRDDEIGHAIAVDGGVAYVSGETHSVDFPLHAPLESQLEGSGDAFVARVGATGALASSTYLGGDDEDSAWGIAVSKGLLRGRPTIHVVGITYSSDLATPGALQPMPQGGADGFIAHLRTVP